MGNRKLFFQFHIYVNIAVPPSILIPCIKLTHQGFPDGSGGKESACNVGDLGLIPALGRSPGEGHATHSSVLACRILWTEEPDSLQAIVNGVSNSWT